MNFELNVSRRGQIFLPSTHSCGNLAKPYVHTHLSAMHCSPFLLQFASILHESPILASTKKSVSNKTVKGNFHLQICRHRSPSLIKPDAQAHLPLRHTDDNKLQSSAAVQVCNKVTIIYNNCNFTRLAYPDSTLYLMPDTKHHL